MSDLNNNLMKLPPFKWFVLQNFPFIEADFDALTNWQLFCKLGGEISKIVDSLNMTGEQIETLTNAFTALQNYVNNYFDNLDVQEEINNKLDDMADNGELEAIIAEYLSFNTLFCFNNVADMKSAENLVNGTFVRTFGFYSYQDNGGALYKIRTLLNTDTVDNMTLFAITNSDNLVAELVNTKDVIDIRQLGAKSTTVSPSFDNIYVIQKALTKFDKVIIADGTYNVGSVLQLKDNNHIVGINGKLISELPYIISGNEVDNIIIEDLELESTVDTSDTINMSESTPDERGYTTLSSIIDIKTSSNITIRHCKVKGSFTGIFIPWSTNVTVENCDCSDASSKIVCLSASQFKLLNNYIHDVKVEDGDYYACYLFQASDSQSSRQELSIISGNMMENNPVWDGILMHDYDKMIIANNTIKNVRQGIDMSLIPSAEGKESGNVVISNNYLEGTDTNSWGSNMAQNHGIYVSGNSYQAPIVINNNIMNNFGKFYSGTGGSALCLSAVQNATVSGNTIDFTGSLTTLKGAIILTGACGNLNVSNNVISANDQSCIYFYTLTASTLNIYNNNLVTTANYAINTNGGSNITSLLLDNTFVEANTQQFCVNNGDNINRKSYSVALLRAEFNKKYRFEYKIASFTVSANSSVNKDITKANVGFTGLFNSMAYIGIGVPATSFPDRCVVKIRYLSSDTLRATFINTSSSSITIPESTYTIDYKY